MFRDLNSILWVLRLKDFVSLRFEKFPNHPPDRELIFRQEHCLRAFGYGNADFRGCGHGNIFARNWQIHSERAALAWLALDLDRTTALFHDSILSRETQARPLARLLGSEKGFEDVRSCFCVHATTCVDDLDEAITLKRSMFSCDFRSIQS